MAALLVCPTCGSLIIFPSGYLGTAGACSCPNCGLSVTIPVDKPSPEALGQFARKIREEVLHADARRRGAGLDSGQTTRCH